MAFLRSLGVEIIVGWVSVHYSLSNKNNIGAIEGEFTFKVTPIVLGVPVAPGAATVMVALCVPKDRPLVA